MNLQVSSGEARGHAIDATGVRDALDSSLISLRRKMVRAARAGPNG